METNEQVRLNEKLAKIKKEMAQYDLYDVRDVENALTFAEALMEIELEDTEKHEGYATRTIQEMRIARDRLISLYHSFGDISDNLK